MLTLLKPYKSLCFRKEFKSHNEVGIIESNSVSESEHALKKELAFEKIKQVKEQIFHHNREGRDINRPEKKFHNQRIHEKLSLSPLR